MLMKNQRMVRWVGIGVLMTLAMLGAGHYRAKAEQSGTAGSEGNPQPFVIEYYYKAKWGHADEFLALFKKNHYPTGPRYHTTEDGRWDYRVTIVFKSAAIANDNFDSGPLIKQLYPDQESYKKEEQRRFEILDAHWDLPIKEVDLDGR